MPTGPPAQRDLAGRDPDVALAGRDDARAVRAEQLRVREARFKSLKKNASSCAGTPSVMTTMNSMPASAASITASVTPGAGMKMHDAFAPVASRASATVAKIGTPSTSVPAFFGFVPATTCVPYAWLRRPWNRPCDPVRPW